MPAVASRRDATAGRDRAEPPPPAESFEQFGQYALLERIAVGGMAEVWKARMRGVEGFQKTVAIKRILPHLTDSGDFVSMFVDEAKLAAQLSHPNIIHIYDLGKIGQHYYIAMEYVEGQNLRAILNARPRRAMPLPVGLDLLIGARLASALDYAHRKRDFDHREMGLVHRDVSPQNVLISYDGDIKLCDFGIAKAVANASRTQMGALKGKLQYMSPEQAWGRPVDPRSDIFSLGSLLFEMLTGRRLFTGDNEISVLEAVRECHVEEPSRAQPGDPRGVQRHHPQGARQGARRPLSARRRAAAGARAGPLLAQAHPGAGRPGGLLERLRSAPAAPPAPHSPPAPPAPSGTPSSAAEESAAPGRPPAGVDRAPSRRQDRRPPGRPPRAPSSTSRPSRDPPPRIGAPGAAARARPRPSKHRSPGAAARARPRP